MSKPGPKQVLVGNRTLTVGKQLLPLQDSTTLYRQGKSDELLKRLKEDGYLFVKGALSNNTVRKGRHSILEFVEKKGAIMPKTDLAEARIGFKQGKKNQYQEGFCISTRTGGCTTDREPESTQPEWMKFAKTAPIKNIYDGHELHTFFGTIFGKQNFKTFPECTWLRLKGRGEVTAEHADYYYFKGATSIFSDNMRQESDPRDLVCQVCHKDERAEETLICDICDKGFHMDCAEPKVKEVPDGEWHCKDCANLPYNFYTCWISWGEARIGQEGGLSLVPGSHQSLSGFNLPLPGKPLLPQDYREHKASLKWCTADYSEGDIVLFNIKTVHAASKNYSLSYRVSCDTRVFHSEDGKELAQAYISQPGHEPDRLRMPKPSTQNAQRDSEHANKKRKICSRGVVKQKSK